MRNDGRKNVDIRPIKTQVGFTMHAEGSVLYCQGNTKVLCTATVEDKVPPYIAGTGKGWITAEYSMLPRATKTRNTRDVSKLKLSPRSTEIQRLIGRALRGAVDLEKLGERSIIIDCDVIQADGGTRCASITGGFIALLMFNLELSIIAMVGFIMLSGIIVNNGIVLIDYINELRLSGMEKREAILTAGKTRMRPILMTALTTVMGLIFMAAANGLGSELMQPVALVSIGGLLYGTLMTLFVVPALYDIFNKKELKRVIIDEEDEAESENKIV